MKLFLQILAAILGLLIVLLVTVHLMFFQEFQETIDDMQPFMEMQGVHLRGWDKATTRWEVFAQRGLLQDRNTSELLEIHGGTVFNNHGQPILYNLHAKQGIVIMTNKRVTLQKVSVNVVSKGMVSTETVKLVCDELILAEKHEKALLRGHVKITQGAVLVEGEWADLDGQRDEIFFDRSVRVIEEGLTMNAQQMWFQIFSKTILMKGQVEIQRMVRWETATKDQLIEILCGQMDYQKSGRYHSMAFSDQVQMFVQGAELTGDTGTFWSENDQLQMSGNVRLKLGKTTEEDPFLLPPESQLSAQRIWFDFQSAQMRLDQDVQFIKPGVKITADRGKYNKKSETLVLFGQVTIDENRQLLHSDEVVINIRDGSFQASGKVRTKISI